MSSHYDMIIIGSGAGGGTMALALAPTGKRILLLERGDYPGLFSALYMARSESIASTPPTAMR
jgi:choline dehydrogenase-like flavoprotein